MRSKTIVVMPAYNAEKTLKKTIDDIPLYCVDEIILVDDASKDNTVTLAKSIGSSHPQLHPYEDRNNNKDNKTLFTIFVCEQNRGYGGNQKKCYELALSHGATVVVMLHPDYQYDPKLIKFFKEFIEDGHFDVVLGSRIRSRQEALAGGMPIYKYFANRVLSFLENVVTGRNLSEWHTGMRAYKREVLENIPYEKFSNDFVFDSQMLLAIVEKNYSIGDIPIPVRYSDDSSSINFFKSLKYGLLTIFELFKFWWRKTF